MADTASSRVRPARWLQAIGLWEVFGGIVSLGVFLDTLGQKPNSDAKIVAIILAGVICVLSVLAGYAVLKRRRAGIKASILIQSIQLLAVGLPWCAIQIVLGPYWYFGLTSTWVGFDFGFRPRLVLQVGNQVRPLIFGVNLLAVGFLMALWRSLYGVLTPRPSGPEVANDRLNSAP